MFVRRAACCLLLLAALLVFLVLLFCLCPDPTSLSGKTAEGMREIEHLEKRRKENQTKLATQRSSQEAALEQADALREKVRASCGRACFFVPSFRFVCFPHVSKVELALCSKTSVWNTVVTHLGIFDAAEESITIECVVCT